MQVEHRISEILPLVSRPSRYLGWEYHSIRKDPASVRLRVALVFPDTYEIGMSHLGLKILYHILNGHPQVMAERAFAPWIDAEAIMRRRGIPLSSQESGLPLSSFDVLGFTLQYELSYTNILNVLDLAGIPLRREEREEGYPLIMAGGPCAFNPEPLSDFVDLFVMGEAEEAILEVAEEYLAWKGSGRGKGALLEHLSRYPGIFCPALQGSETDRRIEKRLIANLDSAPYPTAFIVPFMEIVHDRLNIEVGRGCSQGCRFCQAGMVLRPVRERSADRICQLVLRSLKETGYEEVSLFSLNATDHSCLEGLLPPLMAHLERERISLSLPSIRTDGLSLSILNQIKRVRKTGLTLAPEAGSQRLRDVINKGLDEESVLEAARAAASAGWEGMKLYFMIGLPTEREEDVLEIARLAKEALRAGRVEGKENFHLTVSLSSFIPKPHTPFQWVAQAPLEELKEKLDLLRNRMKGGQLSLKWQLPEMSFLEAVFSRGDQSLGKALMQAHSLGCRFDGWTEQLRFDLWEKAFSNSQIDPRSYSYRSYNPEAHLPWDHVSVGVSKDFLRREYEKAKAGEISPDCQVAGCLGCGLECPVRRPPIASEPSPISRLSSSHAQVPPPERVRVRFRFRKGEEARFLSHLEILRTFGRAIRRAGIPICYSHGFHPHPRLRIAWALPVGVCGESEWGEMELEGRGALSEIGEGLNRYLPLGLELQGAEEVPLSSPPLERLLSQASYHISLEEGPALDLARRNPLLLSPVSAEDFSREATLLASSRRKGRLILVDLKPLMVEFSLREGEDFPSWNLILRLSPEGGIHPSRVMARFFSKYLDEEEADDLLSGLKVTRKALS